MTTCLSRVLFACLVGGTVLLRKALLKEQVNFPSGVCF